MVQDHSTSGLITAAAAASLAPSPLAAPARWPCEPVPADIRPSRRPMMSSLGESGWPLFQAGQADWHRPHSVQVSASSRCFQVSSSSCGTCAGALAGSSPRAPSARGRRENATFSGAMTMCKCLE